ncbi:hypothetical protein PPSAL_2632 [Ectopseudomonas oleovorans]|uniref:Uncharacterized protein n=1 Tax=Ectopseudomonas oleovorans (strain CECT 5344) TaxID=1182590 RepID=W6R4E4_ECTO5|nr:hypothetical protein BN5_2666 [Pseudomonas oleovorans CECT 5344]CDR91859.1 hypothetical protein PPSAL_2632 [Pseudomonas oleovorans]
MDRLINWAIVHSITNRHLDDFDNFAKSIASLTLDQ